jgi:hypothetical protein
LHFAGDHLTAPVAIFKSNLNRATFAWGQLSYVFFPHNARCAGGVLGVLDASVRCNGFAQIINMAGGGSAEQFAGFVFVVIACKKGD